MKAGITLLLLVIPLFTIAKEHADPDTAFVRNKMASYQSEADTIADSLWQWAELGYKETRSTALMQDVLSNHGFTVTPGVAGIPTAFEASFGNEGPVIALLAEMDALPGLSQQPSATKQKQPGMENGHACGHHLFAGGAIGAALIIKDYLEQSGLPGQIRVYGTPAEEGGSGKVYMAREGLFDDVDIALHWHPGDRNSARASSSLANKSAKFRFYGVAAHAAAAPERGRSALDAVEAMNMMVNLMREHVPDGTRIHYVITNGGAAPNIVPDFAEVYYYVRSPEPDVVLSLWDRLTTIADAAAMGTETRVDYEVLGGTWNLLPNLTLAAQMDSSMHAIGGIEYSSSEQTFAKDIAPTLGNKATQMVGTQKDIEPFSEVIPVWSASTDVGDVSWQVPTAGIRTATWVPGTPPHSWQAVAAGGTTIGKKGMTLAASTLALTAIKLYQQPEKIKKANAEFNQRRAGIDYQPLVGERQPALNYRD
ncbi:amidohydrolase [Alteromonas sp. C1M14]|uniref:amidohydrolase n=1 Tax=Alteromonas sp. C1M14 TaxID=2841567 RepID=UPI001C09AEF7|nr:amidohydrolase [Alteromonas sp. C1M14]MBU2977672.1 amidohydrolase [Alteromonas sp. C1M14]